MVGVGMAINADIAMGLENKDLLLGLELMKSYRSRVVCNPEMSAVKRWQTAAAPSARTPRLEATQMVQSQHIEGEFAILRHGRDQLLKEVLSSPVRTTLEHIGLAGSGVMDCAIV